MLVNGSRRLGPFIRSTFKLQTQCQFLKTSAQHHTPKVRLHEKIRDSFLILEAKQGIIGKTVVGIGQGFVTGGLVFGSGALVYYSLFEQSQKDVQGAEFITTNSDGDLQNIPEFAKGRIHTAYMYMLNSLSISGLGAMASFRLFTNPAFLQAVSANPLTALGLTMGSQFLVTLLVRKLPYEEGFGAKQLASCAQATIIGLAAAPLYLLGAGSIIRAGFVTAGVIGGLTGLSSIVPQNAFDSWENPLRIGMYAVFLSFMSLWLLPRGHVAYPLLYKVAMHGGLVLFPAYYLHNSKVLVKSAMISPTFDPINSSMALFTDVLNIYGRLAFLLPPHYGIGLSRIPRRRRLE